MKPNRSTAPTMSRIRLRRESFGSPIGGRVATGHAPGSRVPCRPAGTGCPRCPTLSDGVLVPVEVAVSDDATTCQQVETPPGRPADRRPRGRGVRRRRAAGTRPRSCSPWCRQPSCSPSSRSWPASSTRSRAADADRAGRRCRTPTWPRRWPGIVWPDAVHGCALAQEIVVLPPDAEAGLPAGRRDEHAPGSPPSTRERREARLVAAVLRDGSAACVLRLRGGRRPRGLVEHPELAPNLTDALLATCSPVRTSSLDRRGRRSGASKGPHRAGQRLHLDQPQAVRGLLLGLGAVGRRHQERVGARPRARRPS